MAGNAAPAAPVKKTPEEVQAEVEVRMRDISQRFGTIPENKDELLRLLEDAVFWLNRVNQSPPESMYNALRPTMSALITNDLMEHQDPSVKVALAACLTQVTRITTQEGAPYDDDVMKEVFKRIVETFGDLDDMNSPSYARRVSILDVFACIHFCVLMLDLNLDQMILYMFGHFFKTASTRHSEHVTHCMEYTMMFAIQESDDVHAELASCLLQNLTKQAQETLPASFGLAERVLHLCSEKLKPVLHELLKGTPLDEYSNVVTMLFQDAGEKNVDASEKNMAAQGKLSEKSVPDESPKETSKADQNVNCLDQERSSPSSTPTTASTQKQQLTSGNEQIPDSKPTDTKPAVVKPKRGRPPAAKSQEKKHVGKKHASYLKSAKSQEKKHVGKKHDVTDKDTEEDISLKEMVTPTRIDKSKGQQEDSGLSSKRKGLQEAQEIPVSHKNNLLDENLIGSRVQVWWPDDKMFYPGVVSSYDASAGKHKVTYDDGDVEILVLKEEIWEFIAAEQDTDPDASSNIKAEGSSSQQTKGVRIGTPQSDVRNLPKKRGRPKGVRSSSNMPNAEDEVKSNEAIDGSKTTDLSAKRKQEDNEAESSSEEKGSAKTTTSKKRTRRSRI